MRRFAFWAIATAGLLAYCNSFGGPFLFDDHYFIQDIRVRLHFWPLWKALLPPAHFQPFVHRPILMLSFAINHALHGLDPRGYHAVNFLIHFANGLLVFEIVRRTLQSNSLKSRYGAASEGLALATALLWIVHPLQTESVTYIYQRAESLTGFFYLFTLYGVIRRWKFLAVAACALGMGTKQTMVTAPIAALLYDRIFLARSWKELFHERKGLYAALAATWGIVIFLLATAPQGNPENAGFSFKAFTPLEYARTMPEVLLHYLGLTFWPHPLVFDYLWPIARGGRALAPAAFGLAGLLAATGWALRIRPKIGFLGAWFFLILAPISSFIPCGDPAAEHRMYLPLASLIAGVVIGAHEILRRLLPSQVAPRRAAAILLVLSAGGTLAGLTFRRNKDYRSEIALWTDTLAQRPDSFRANNNLGVAYERQGLTEAAIPLFIRTVELRPDDPNFRNDLGAAFVKTGRLEEGFQQFAGSLRLDPRNARTYLTLGKFYDFCGDPSEASRWYRRVPADEPRS